MAHLKEAQTKVERQLKWAKENFFKPKQKKVMVGEQDLKKMKKELQELRTAKS